LRKVRIRFAFTNIFSVSVNLPSPCSWLRSSCYPTCGTPHDLIRLRRARISHRPRLVSIRIVLHNADCGLYVAFVVQTVPFCFRNATRKQKFRKTIGPYQKFIKSLKFFQCRQSETDRRFNEKVNRLQSKGQKHS